MAVYANYRVTFENANSTWARAGAMVGEGSRVLDIGCSAGQLARALTEFRGCIVDGVEIDPDDAALAAQYCRQVWAGDLLELAEELPRDYDHVLMLDVLEHVHDPAAALRVVAALLAPGGSAVISVPNMAHASVRLQLLQGHFPAEDEGLLDRTHLRFFDEWTLRSLVAESPLALATLDRIVMDVLPSTTREALRSVGLEVTPAFSEYLGTREAATYQFVARLVPKPEAGAEALPERTEYVAPLTQYWDTVRDLQQRLATSEAELQRREATSLRVPAPFVRVARALARGRRTPR